MKKEIKSIKPSEEMQKALAEIPKEVFLYDNVYGRRKRSYRLRKPRVKFELLDIDSSFLSHIFGGNV